MFFVRRKDGLSAEEFQRRYIEHHAPLALEHWVTLQRYVVNVAREPDEDPGDGFLFDAVAEMRFDSLDDFADRERLYGPSGDVGTVERDAAELFGAATIYRVNGRVERGYERTWLAGERSPGNKMVAPLWRKDGLTHGDFVAHWRGTHAPLALEHVLGIGRYVTNEVTGSLTPDAPDIDGIVEVHYTEKRQMATTQSEGIMAEDVASFLVQPKRHMVWEYVFRD
jgi:hypothetical protein